MDFIGHALWLPLDEFVRRDIDKLARIGARFTFEDIRCTPEEALEAAEARRANGLRRYQPIRSEVDPDA